MRATLTKQEYESWKDKELEIVKEILSAYEITLDEIQNHIIGERYLMSGKKLVLQGKNKDKKVIIKYSNDGELVQELKDERQRKKTLENINFGYKSLYFPKEVLYESNPKFTILVTEFIDQETVFVKFPLERQFFLALKALEAFEGVHSVVAKHQKVLNNLSKPKNADTYLKSFEEMYTETKEIISKNNPLDIPVIKNLEKAKIFLESNKNLIEKYSDFLTHDDFVPHNMRVLENDVVVLDHSSLVVGNKYESWARFLNFMVLYGKQIEEMLAKYVLDNRGLEEYTTLRLMRAYKISFLINFYTKAIIKTEGPLYIITKNRLAMWTQILDCILEDKEIPKDLIKKHFEILDANRSSEEKKRHKEISG